MLQRYLAELMLKILNRIIDAKNLIGIERDKITSASFDTKNFRPLGDIVLSEDIISSLKKAKEVDRAKFKLNVRQHFVAAELHIVKKTSYNNQFVKSLQYIAPSHILKPESREEIKSVAKLLPFPIHEWCLIKAVVHAKKLVNF